MDNPTVDPVDGPKASILVVDDEDFIREIICRKLSGSGFECDSARSAEDALARIAQNDYDCVLSDIHMPGMSGVDLLRQIKLQSQDLAVILITGAPDIDAALEAMRLGAYDHLSKPLNLAALEMTVDRALEKKRLVEENREYQRNLESMVQERTKQLSTANEDLQRLFTGSIKALAQALEAKDEYTQGHSARVAEESVNIARYLSLSDTEIQRMWLAGYLHDIGKIGIKEAVLNKPGKLNEEEWHLIQQHPVVAGRILGPIPELSDIIDIIVHHHERYDGSGYPDGLEGNAIPLGARILAVADTYDALTSRRPYRDSLTLEEAHRILEEAAGTYLDPVIARAFLNLKRGVKAESLQDSIELESENVQDAKYSKSGLSGVTGTPPLELS
ncbi:MAG: response regulator [Candidatus Eisenbacteria sp.]|nr:response regulator [Candidatus Eisenbacteria bacterium]MCK5597197.1 response regulator [Candidatus Eisenbacteria bacterium]